MCVCVCVREREKVRDFGGNFSFNVEMCYAAFVKEIDTFNLYIYIYKLTCENITNINFIFFFKKCKLCIDWNWFIAKITLISQKYLFWGYSKWQQIKKSTRGLNRELSSNFYWLRIANHGNLTEDWVMCMEKHILVKKYVYRCSRDEFSMINLSGNTRIF